MKELSKCEFEKYLQCLRKLVGFPTVFTQPDQIEKAVCWCESYFSQHLNNYDIYRDQNRNLIACPETIDRERDIIYLSAHIDTVDADAAEWNEPFSPFSLYENDTEMVARGVSDCKAGVAFELFLTELVYLQKMKLSNLIFTITFKEEGAGEKTSIQIGEELGKGLPVSKKDTFLIVLENTVTVSQPPTLSYYTAERGNFVIRISDTLEQLRLRLSCLKEWNPVSIQPDVEKCARQKATLLTQKGGHVCSVSREVNLLTKVIEQSANTDLLWAGSASGFSVIPSKIYKGSAPPLALNQTVQPIVHHLTLSNRSFDTLDDIKLQLEGIAYEEVKDFSISQGMNFDLLFSEHPISQFFKTGCGSDLSIEHTYNTGVSDATIISRCMNPELKQRFYPLVMGPGTRSQRQLTPPRLTHGKNETFDKESGKAAIEYILSVLIKIGAVTPLE
jgi:acetylornithine deacetylase/succinyl-diaminopimelate desuccinylase-like protein